MIVLRALRVLIAVTASIFTLSGCLPDAEAPNPNPMTWSSPPAPAAAALSGEEVIFSESFETPNVDDSMDYNWTISGFNANGAWPGWVGVNRYTGILNQAANNASPGLFSNAFGSQVAYIFNFLPTEDTDASLTTTADSLNAVIAPDTVYSLSFNTASQSDGAIHYHVELLAIDDNAFPPIETVLGTASGPINSKVLTANADTIVFRSQQGHPNLGQRIAIRLKKGEGHWENNVYYDNLKLSMSTSQSNEESIGMLATTASDPSSVEYYFAETSGNPGGDDSGWQSSPAYEDSGCTPGLTYTYTVKARDRSPAANTTTTSSQASATCSGVTNGSPTANFTVLASELTASFTDASFDSDGSVVSHHWSFGDGASSTETDPTHTYNQSGSYTVSLKVTDNQSATDTITKTVNVSDTYTGNNAELHSALKELKDHINGQISLNANQVEAHKLTIDRHHRNLGSDNAVIIAAFDLVRTYDDIKGPLWIARGPFSRNSVANDIDWTIYNVMQYIVDWVYNGDNLTSYSNIIDGFKFGSAAHFPGVVEATVNPNTIHRTSIKASYPKAFGRPTMYTELPARKPTGTYLAPGSIATVTVPGSMVGKGFQVRIGAHSWDHSNKGSVKRLDRSSILYDINSTEVKVASPLGGGIYIEVPYLANAGVVEIQIKNAVRSPYFSAKPFHTTSLQEWRNTERHHKAPWADFQTGKFMMSVPTSWIYNLDDPVTLMQNWDKAMDTMNDLMGYPHDRGKEAMYPQIDVQNRASVFAPGYPSVNSSYDPNKDYGGNHNHHLIRGPQYAPDYEFHEQGHGYLFVKFGGEMESTVNLLHVPIWHLNFGYSLDQAFAGSRGAHNNEHRTLDNTAITWMTSFNFSPRRVPMHSAEKSYQLKGHAKYVEIARLFGWEALNRYWHSINVDHENGIVWSKHGTPIDTIILRLSESANADVTPLLHFWGTHPQDRNALKTKMNNNNIRPSSKVYDALVHYKSLVPANNAAFQDFALKWWGKKPSVNGYWTETEHARQFDNEEHLNKWPTPIRPNGEIYDENAAAELRDTVQDIIDLYFPSGRP